MGNELPTRRQLVVLAVLFEGGLGAVAWLLGRLLEQPPLATLRWRAVDFAWGGVACLPLLLLFLILMRWPVGPLCRIKQFSAAVIRPLFAPCSLAELALISLAAGIGEEMLFRGFLQAALARWLGFWPGWALAGVLFGLLHLITPTYAVLAAFMGCYLGWVWVARDNLLVVIIAHGLYDFIALVYLTRGPSSP